MRTVSIHVSQIRKDYLQIRPKQEPHPMNFLYLHMWDLSDGPLFLHMIPETNGIDTKQ